MMRNSRFKSLKNSATVQNTVWALLGNLIKQGSQLLTFVLLTRAIGVDGFGAFSAVLGLAAFTSPFVELGGVSLIVRDIHQRGLSFSSAIERSLQVSFAVFPFILALLLVLKPLLFDKISWTVVMTVILAELLGNRIVALFYGLNIARERLKITTFIEISIGILRLLFVSLLVALGGNVELWGMLYLFQSMIVSFCILFYLFKKLKIKIKLRIPNLTEINEGFHFAVGSASHTAYNEIDKVMLVRFSNLENAGIFSTASRVVYLTAIFLFSITGALYPRFFGSGGTNPFKLAFRLLPYTFLYGLICAIILFFSAPWLSSLLGSDFKEVSEALRILAIISVLNAIHYPLADAFTGSGMQKFRTNIYVISLFINIFINLISIPRFGWLGAAYATLFTQTVLVLILFWNACLQMRKIV